MTADGLREMLSKRHAGDVFVSECKDGATQTRSHRRLDAWVLRRTWSPITTIGYEIKVSKSDWRRDEKLADYMPLCHLLYIVAPKGIVPPDELPAGIGLLEPVGDSGRLQMKRKAVRREIELPAELMVYVLMCRTKITRDRLTTDESGERHWRIKALQEWISGKEERRALSYAVSQKIRLVFEQQQAALNAERRRNDQLENIRARVVDLGFDPSQPVELWRVTERINAINRTVDDLTIRELRQTSKTMDRLASRLEALRVGRSDIEEAV